MARDGYSHFRSAQPIFRSLGPRCASCLYQMDVCGSYGGNYVEKLGLQLLGGPAEEATEEFPRVSASFCQFLNRFY